MRYCSKAKREKAHENAVRRGKRSGIVRAQKRMVSGMNDSEPKRRDAGEWIGELQWRDSSGKVRRWPIRQGQRKNRICVADTEHGWDWLLSRLRYHLSPLTR